MRIPPPEFSRWHCRYERLSTVHPKGEYRIGEDGFMEFHADEAALDKLVIQTCYDQVSLTPAS